MSNKTVSFDAIRQRRQFTILQSYLPESATKLISTDIDLTKSEDIKKLLDTNLEKGLITKELHSKALEQLNQMIEKGGEGSKGGKVIGHTKSGEPIYESQKSKLKLKPISEAERQQNESRGKSYDSTRDPKAATFDEFKHHRMMAGFHAVKERELADEIQDLKSSSDKSLHKVADIYELKRKEHAEREQKHLKTAKGLHDPKKHGNWNSTTPSHDDASKYGKSHFKKSSDSSNPFSSFEPDINKGKSFPIGTVHNGFKKVKEGVWKKVSEHRMTQKEHENKSNNYRGVWDDDADRHSYEASKLDDKDYTDVDVIGGDKESEVLYGAKRETEWEKLKQDFSDNKITEQQFDVKVDKFKQVVFAEVYKEALKAGNTEERSEQIARKQANDIISKSEIFDEENLPGYSSVDILKSHIDTSKLVKKQIQVKTKTGKVFMATRWVDPKTGHSPATHEKVSPETNKVIISTKGKDDENSGALIVSAIEKIINDLGTSNTIKIRDLLALGCYDRKDIMNLIPTASYQDVFRLMREAGIDMKEFSGKGGDGGEKIRTGKNMPAEENIDGFPPDNIDELSEKKLEKILAIQRQKRAEAMGITYHDKWDLYGIHLDNLILTGNPKSLIAYGTGGVGKSYTLQLAFEKNKIRLYDKELNLSPQDYDAIVIKGTTGLRDIWSRIINNRDKIIVFDDCDSMWQNGKDDIQNILKGMLDTTGDGQVEYPNAGKDEDGNPLPKSVKFKGQVVFISNLERRDFPQPLIDSRCAAIDLTMTKDQTLEKIDSIKDKVVVRDKRDNEIPISKESRKEAHSFMVRHKNDLRIGQINGRIFGQLAILHQRLKDTNDIGIFEKQAMIATNLV